MGVDVEEGGATGIDACSSCPSPGVCVCVLGSLGSIGRGGASPSCLYLDRGGEGGRCSLVGGGGAFGRGRSRFMIERAIEREAGGRSRVVGRGFAREIRCSGGGRPNLAPTESGRLRRLWSPVPPTYSIGVDTTVKAGLFVACPACVVSNCVNKAALLSCVGLGGAVGRARRVARMPSENGSPTEILSSRTSPPSNCLLLGCLSTFLFAPYSLLGLRHACPFFPCQALATPLRGLARLGERRGSVYRVRVRVLGSLKKLDAPSVKKIFW